MVVRSVKLKNKKVSSQLYSGGFLHVPVGRITHEALGTVSNVLKQQSLYQMLRICDSYVIYIYIHLSFLLLPDQFHFKQKQYIVCAVFVPSLFTGFILFFASSFHEAAFLPSRWPGSRLRQRRGARHHRLSWPAPADFFYFEYWCN